MSSQPIQKKKFQKTSRFQMHTVLDVLIYKEVSKNVLNAVLIILKTETLVLT